jgi:hypothetical protein
MFEHIPKINTGLGCLVLACFFLPWISFSCGTVTFLDLSGYHLTAGKVPVDESVVRQYEQRGGSVSGDERIPESMKGSAPRYIFLIVPLCAVNIIAFSLRMIDGGMDRFKAVAVMAFADIGFVFLVGAAVLEFGLELPPSSGLLIQSSLEPGYFASLFGFFAVAGGSILTMRAVGQARVPSPADELESPDPPPGDPGAVLGTETVSAEVAEHFGITPPKKPEVRPQAPPGARTCPGCGVVVGQYQVKCVKCGSAIKPAQ